MEKCNCGLSSFKLYFVAYCGAQEKLTLVSGLIPVLGMKVR